MNSSSRYWKDWKPEDERQVGPDRAVFGRRHGGQHVPGMHQLVHDARHPRQHLEGRRQVAGADVGAHGLQFVQHQLDPQFAGLVLDDEQHLVVVGRERMLGRQDLAQAQVVAIAHAAAEVHLGAVPFAGLSLVLSVMAAPQVTAPRAASAS
jgi:hypothetical protein